MNVNLGTPYEFVIQEIMKKGYAGNQTEVIRQALLFYERGLAEEEEVRLVNKGIAAEIEKIRTGKEKTVSLGYIKKKYKL